jgi:ribonuclease HI
LLAAMGLIGILVFLDSALVVNTVNGDWKVEPEHLKDLCAMACVLVKEFADIRMCWVPREMNLEADALASRARSAAAVHEVLAPFVVTRP